MKHASTAAWPLLFWAMLVSTLIALLWPLSRPKSGWELLWWNWGHTPLFALLTWTARGYFRHRGCSSGQATLSASCTAVLFAFGSEALQYFTGRAPEWSDVFADLLGAAVGILAAEGL